MHSPVDGNLESQITHPKDFTQSSSTRIFALMYLSLGVKLRWSDRRRSPVAPVADAGVDGDNLTAHYQGLIQCLHNISNELLVLAGQCFDLAGCSAE